MHAVDHLRRSFSRTPPRTSRRGAFVESLPDEILLEIADRLSTLSDRVAFASASSGLYAGVIPSVYSSVELDGFERCKDTLTMLSKSPHVARHVRKLVVHPDRNPDSKIPLLPFSREYCSLVSTLVAHAARHMDALDTFFWDADGAVAEDLMWRQLKIRCPLLRNIGTTFVQDIPAASSSLLLFRGLESFKLIYKGSFYTTDNFWIKETDPAYQRLWDMLIHHSPNLRSLCIEGDWDEPIHEPRLLEGCWPHLQVLRLGPIKFNFNWHLQDSTLPLLGFLERHPSIEELSLAHVSVDLSRLSPYALPKLKILNGYMDDLRGLSSRRIAGQDLVQNQNQNAFPGDDDASSITPQLSENLQTLNILEPLKLRELTPLAVSGMLSGLHALTSLTIVFSLQNGYDSNGVFRSIVSACPQLLHLDLTCTCKPSFQLDAFSRTLRGLNRLRTLSLTTVKVSGDESMKTGAKRIASSNPRLTQFTIAYIPANKPIRRGYLRPQPVEVGRFTLVCDTHGIPIRLLVWESWHRFGGIGSRVTGKSVCELRPSGHPHAMRKGWMEVLQERSPAGEEARLLLFSGLLLALAMWGTIVSLMSNRWRVGSAITEPKIPVRN